jgi:hypothetical protein
MELRMSLARQLLAALMLVLAFAPALPAEAAQQPYQTGLTRWRAADDGFAGWERSGVALAAGALVLDPATAASESDPHGPGGYNGGTFYNGGAFSVGQATSPVVTTGFGFSEAIASWNVDTPPGTWVETLIRAQVGGRWTKWYNLGVWAADNSTIERHSVRLQGDADGFVAVDTLVLTAKKAPAGAFQLQVRLFQAQGSTATPSVRGMAVAVSTTPGKPKQLAQGSPSRWNTLLDLPECSQMVYPDGGEVWCSPTSTSMVLGYWGANGPCEPRVRAAVDGVFDWVYDGHGNWPFNTAYAATQGLEAYVTRFTSLAQAEAWVQAGVPVIMSFAWGKNDLDGAAIPSSAGHLAVLVGFDATGNPIVNDPAAAADADVQRTYDRAQLETLWLTHSGGTVYLIYPASRDVDDLWQ